MISPIIDIYIYIYMYVKQFFKLYVVSSAAHDDRRHVMSINMVRHDRHRRTIRIIHQNRVLSDDDDVV